MYIIRKFLAETNIDPDNIVRLWKEKRFDYKEREVFLTELNEAIEDYYYNSLVNYTMSSKHTIIFTIIGFFKANKIPVDPDIRGRVTVVYHNRAIKKEEIRRILDHSTLRSKVFYLMMVESGQRPATLVRLRYKHIKEEFEEGKLPMCINLPSELLKDNVGDRFSFIGEDCYKLLKEYLQPRQPLDNEALVFAPIKKTMKENHLTTNNFSGLFSRIVKKLGIDKVKEHGKPKEIRLYCLRKYFRNHLPIDRDYREFLMGHKSTLGVDQHYISRDKELYRELYSQAYPNLRIFSPENRETSKKVDELMKALTTKDKEVKDLKKRVDLLTQIVARAVNKEDMEALRETWGAFLTDILMQMEGKEVPKRAKVTKGIKEELKEEA